MGVPVGWLWGDGGQMFAWFAANAGFVFASLLALALAAAEKETAPKAQA